MLYDPCPALKVRALARAAILGVLVSMRAATAIAQSQLPDYLADRGTGIATSMFGEYVSAGEFVFYPFYENTRFHEYEYKPAELGYALDQDFRGPFVEHEANSFFAYGLTSRILLELESAYWTTATLRKNSSDPSALPPVLKESGFGDTQAELRYRMMQETIGRPELFSYLEVDFPFQRHRRIIGTQGWEYKFGVGAIKGFSFGTLTFRIAGESTQEDHRPALGEYAVEYLKRLSSKVRFYTGIEGDQDEVEYIVEGQYWLSRHVHLKLNTAVGVTSKAADFAPEVGVFFSFPASMGYPARR